MENKCYLCGMFVEKLEKRFNLSHPIIVADAGLLSKKNKKPGITFYRAKSLAESLYNIEYVNPYNGKKCPSCSALNTTRRSRNYWKLSG